MVTKVQQLWLVEEAQVMLALETSPERRLWRSVDVAREQGTGRDVVKITAVDGATEAVFEFHGPTVIGLGDADLQRERERMMLVMNAAREVVASIDAHLALRRGPPQIPTPDDSILLPALDHHRSVELTVFPESSRFVEIRWTLSLQPDNTIRAHADRFEDLRHEVNAPLDLTLDRAGAEDHLAGLMEIDVHVRWPDQPNAVAPTRGGVLDSHAFSCKTSGQVAGTVSLHPPSPPSAKHRVALTGFSLAGNAEWSVEPAVRSRLRAALFGRDARALWLHDAELAPFFCPECDACYAASVWQARHDSPTRVDGICPAGHRRRLSVD